MGVICAGPCKCMCVCVNTLCIHILNIRMEANICVYRSLETHIYKKPVTVTGRSIRWLENKKKEDLLFNILYVRKDFEFLSDTNQYKIDQLSLTTPQPGAWPPTQVCALSGN